MPSFISHSITGATASYICKKRFPEIKYKTFLLLSIIAANLPDLDVFFHQSALGQYHAFMHRNFFHSIIFATIFSIVIGSFFFSKLTGRKKFEVSLYFFLVICSHNILDALTKGFGVAFFYPFDKTQYNFPITFLNPAGWNLVEFSANNAILREAFFVWFPMTVITTTVYLIRKKLP